MKELCTIVAVISLLVSGVVCEPPAPYAPSGWRPNGPAFELPSRGEQPSQYLPPVDPRNPANTPDVEYGTPEEDVSVQGLPAQEEVPFFQRSPVNGKQNVGPNFNADIQNLNQGYQQSQYQQQQQRYREYERQKQIEAEKANRLPRPQSPAQFVPRTTPTTTEATTTEAPTTTELSLNEGEAISAKKSEKIKVEVSKQNIQEYPGELFLSSLAQLQLQPQFVPLRFGQLNAPLILQPEQSQKQSSGFNAQTHFAALPSILAQQQLQQQKVDQPAFIFGQPQPQVQPVATYQPQAEIQPAVAYQPQAVQPAVTYQPQPQFQAEQAIQPQVFYGQPEAEPVTQFQPEAQYQPAPQYPAQPVILQPQANQIQPQQQFEPQGAFQPQLAQFQPQASQFQPQPGQFQPQPVQFQPQPAQFQPQAAQFQPQPAQFQPQPAQFQPQPAQFQPQPAAFQPQATAFQTQPAAFQPQPAAFQPQPAAFQPQPAQFQPQQTEKDAENIDNSSYQPSLYQQPIIVQQPANQYQPQFQGQPGLIQAQLINYPGQDFNQFQQEFQAQGQFQQQNQYQPQNQGADALQSGLDVNQQGNSVDEPQYQEEDKDEGTTATAVATAFGARTQPRQFPKYGAPYPAPKVQASPGYPTTTESNIEEVTADDGPVVAHAVAIADGSKKKSAKLRRSRIRPIFTLDKSGHLVLAQGQ